MTVFDRALPQDPEAERAVLGSIMVATDPCAVIARIANVLLPADFFKDAHREIYRAALALDNDGIAPDLLAVKQYLRDHGTLEQVGGTPYVSALTDQIPDIARVEVSAGVVKEMALRRRLISTASDAMERALTGGERAADIAADIAEAVQLVRPADALAAVLDNEAIGRRLEALYEDGGVQRGISTGWPSVDERYTVSRGAWTLITGIPSHGKSGFLDHLAVNLANLHKWQVVMFSAENYPAESHIATLIEKHYDEPFNEGPTARMSPDLLRRGFAFVDRYFRFIDPAAERMTLDRLLATASALAEVRPVDALVIDPWNELHHERSKEATETEYISVCLSKIRRWARKHNAHVFLVAHPQKMVKNAAGSYNVPTPYDVSGSAHWRNKADYCLTVYRDLAADDPSVQIHVQKVRRREMGRLGIVTLTYNRITSAYVDPKAPRRRWEVA